MSQYFTKWNLRNLILEGHWKLCIQLCLLAKIGGKRNIRRRIDRPSKMLFLRFRLSGTVFDSELHWIRYCSAPLWHPWFLGEGLSIRLEWQSVCVSRSRGPHGRFLPMLAGVQPIFLGCTSTLVSCWYASRIGYTEGSFLLLPLLMCRTIRLRLRPCDHRLISKSSLAVAKMKQKCPAVTDHDWYYSSSPFPIYAIRCVKVYAFLLSMPNYDRALQSSLVISRESDFLNGDCGMALKCQLSGCFWNA